MRVLAAGAAALDVMVVLTGAGADAANALAEPPTTLITASNAIAFLVHLLFILNHLFL
ncbi:hypothetical protein D3C81_2078500 [compost metagenome]